MKVIRNYKLKSFKMIDNYNINYSPYYTIENGIYKFQDKVTKYKMMYLYGCDCGMERKLINNKLTICYNGQPLNENQLSYLRKRASVQLSSLPKGLGVIKNDCTCNKKR